MKLAFTLSMPGVASWNGRWSGKGRLYVIVKTYGSSRKTREHVERVLKAAPYYYRWSDGWAARIDVREVEAREGTRLAKASNGFCGYDWMVESIWCYGAIYADHEKPSNALTDG